MAVLRPPWGDAYVPGLVGVSSRACASRVALSASMAIAPNLQLTHLPVRLLFKQSFNFSPTGSWAVVLNDGVASLVREPAELGGT